MRPLRTVTGRRPSIDTAGPRDVVVHAFRDLRRRTSTLGEPLTSEAFRASRLLKGRTLPPVFSGLLAGSPTSRLSIRCVAAAPSLLEAAQIADIAPGQALICLSSGLLSIDRELWADQAEAQARQKPLERCRSGVPRCA